MRKITAIILTTIAVLSAFGGCSSVGVKKEAEIILDMNENRTIKDGYISQCAYVENDDYTVDTFEITRRQTNTDKKEDIVIGNATIKNSYFSTDVVCKLTYNYYDNGGWVLDECEFLTDDTPPTSYPLQGVDMWLVGFDKVDGAGYEGYNIRYSYLDSDRMIPEKQDFSQNNDRWSTNVFFVYNGKYHTVTAKMCFVFDQKQGWIIDNAVHGTYYKICAILTSITCDFTALVGTFVRQTSNVQQENNNYLVIDYFDEGTKEIKGSYISNARKEKIVSDFTTTFDVINMCMDIYYCNEYNAKGSRHFSYDFVADEWHSNGFWIEGDFIRQ